MSGKRNSSNSESISGVKTAGQKSVLMECIELSKSLLLIMDEYPLFSSHKEYKPFTIYLNLENNNRKIEHRMNHPGLVN